MTGRFQRIFDRVFGVKPGRDAPKLDRLLWFRRYYLRNLPLAVLVVALLLLVGSGVSGWIAIAIAGPWVIGFTVLNLEIRQERRRR